MESRQDIAVSCSHEFVRYVPAIGMYSFSRGMTSCRWATRWCRSVCFAKKFYAMGWAKEEWDHLDDVWWQQISAEGFVTEVLRVVGIAPKRFRFAVKGEIWTGLPDIDKVRMIAERLSTTHFWIPTRAWHDRKMLRWMIPLRDDHPNLHVMCSVDPSDDQDVIEQLRCVGMPILFAGDNDPDQLRLTEHGVETSPAINMFKCEKTWENRHGHCLHCADGCFSSSQVDVHLKQHR